MEFILIKIRIRWLKKNATPSGKNAHHLFLPKSYSHCRPMVFWSTQLYILRSRRCSCIGLCPASSPLPRTSPRSRPLAIACACLAMVGVGQPELLRGDDFVVVQHCSVHHARATYTYDVRFLQTLDHLIHCEFSFWNGVNSSKISNLSFIPVVVS